MLIENLKLDKNEYCILSSGALHSAKQMCRFLYLYCLFNLVRTKTLLVPKVGLPSGPRRKNSPPDYFCISFVPALTGTKLIPLLFESHRSKSAIFLWCLRWDSNPHGFPHDFESCASASSATQAFAIFHHNIFF